MCEGTKKITSFINFLLNIIIMSTLKNQGWTTNTVENAKSQPNLTGLGVGWKQGGIYEFTPSERADFICSKTISHKNQQKTLLGALGIAVPITENATVHDFSESPMVLWEGSDILSMEAGKPVLLKVEAIKGVLRASLYIVSSINTVEMSAAIEAYLNPVVEGVAE